MMRSQQGYIYLRFHANAGIFCENANILQELLAMDADINVRNMATDLQDIALLDGHILTGEA